NLGAARRTLSGESQPQDEYEVLEDDSARVISLGVGADITEQQLHNLLVKAANKYQEERTSGPQLLNLWVEAYLVKDQHHSKVIAGRLRRLNVMENQSKQKEI